MLATFPDGGAALSRHKCGAGEILVFWGTPDIGGGNLAGMVKSAAETWAGIENPLANGDVSHWLEGRNETLGRHYLLIYEERPGHHSLPVPNIPDGIYFLDDAVSGQRLGLVDGAAARADGVVVEWHEGFSPLKFLRFIPIGKATGWFGKYGNVPTGEKAE